MNEINNIKNEDETEIFFFLSAFLLSKGVDNLTCKTANK